MNKLQKVFQITAQNAGCFKDFETALMATEMAFKCAGHDVPGFAYMALTKDHAEIGEWLQKTSWLIENQSELFDVWDMNNGSAIKAPFPGHE